MVMNLLIALHPHTLPMLEHRYFLVMYFVLLRTTCLGHFEWFLETVSHAVVSGENSRCLDLG